MKHVLCLAVCLALMSALGCQRSPDQVFDKVLTDFGVREPGEEYASASDKVFQRLDAVGETELKRMNQAERHGEVKFQEEGIRGQYYKEVKVYESHFPLEAQVLNTSSQGERGYQGYIEYSYRMYQSARKPTRAEAMATTADIPTQEEGREIYRYRFNSSGVWDGGEGERVRR